MKIMFLRKELLPITALILTGHIVSNKNIPASEEGNLKYNYKENEHLPNYINVKPTFIIVVFRTKSTKSEHYTNNEYKNEVLSAKSDANTVLNKNRLPKRVTCVIIPINDVIRNRKDVLRKKKGKKNRTCKTACKVAVKTVCKDSDCSKKKKKSMAKKCLKKCKIKTD
ncbi:hypothetical protein evm_010387 [Chilo suppressalis]|nr:hypothetical protein evm_010387 [Chilo suppressalis]